MNNILLKKYIDYAVKNVPYYNKSTYSDILTGVYDFHKIPILYKHDVLHHEEEFISKKYRFEFISGDLINKRTSGSTGTSLNVYWSLYDNILCNYSVWKYRMQWYNINPTDNYISFHTIADQDGYANEMPRMYIKNNNLFSINKLYLDKNHIYELLDEAFMFNPTWMSIQPSVLELIISFGEFAIGKISTLKYIELNGEYIHKAQFKKFEEIFPGVIISNVYGSTETGIIALMCPHRHLHIITNNVYVEIINNDNTNKNGEILVTSLKNSVMPFLRYNLGDIGSIDTNKCTCGCVLPVIDIKAGRIGQNITLSNGEKKACYTLLFPIDKINEEFSDAITRFKAIQIDYKHVNIYIELKNEYQNWFNKIKSEYIEIAHKVISKEIDFLILPFDKKEYDVKKNKNQFFKSLVE